MLDGISSFDISRTGTLICKRSRSNARALKWVDKTGRREAILEAPSSYATPRVSPDGERLAYTARADKGSQLLGRQVWIYDLKRHASSQLTFEATTAVLPLWMPGGKYLLFRGGEGLFVVPANRSSKPRLILKLHGLPDDVPEAISPDGRQLALVREGKTTQRDIWLVPLSGDGESLRAGEPKAFLNSVADEINPSFSSDGKWLAYSSSLSGTFTIYVRPLHGAEASWQVSTEEGFLPQWSPEGKTIVFESVQNDRLLAVSYSINTDVFVPGPVSSFGGDVEIPTNGSNPVYSFSPTGKRIAAVVEAGGTPGVRQHPNYVLILNFLNKSSARGADCDFEDFKLHSNFNLKLFTLSTGISIRGPHLDGPEITLRPRSFGTMIYLRRQR